jgi:hypothetical protein
LAGRRLRPQHADRFDGNLLRGSGYAYSYTYGDSDGNGNTDSSRYCDSDGNAYCNGNGHSYSKPDGYANRNSKRFTEAYTHTKASPNTAASPVEIFVGAKICSDR